MEFLLLFQPRGASTFRNHIVPQAQVVASRLMMAPSEDFPGASLQILPFKLTGGHGMGTTSTKICGDWVAVKEFI